MLFDESPQPINVTNRELKKKNLHMSSTLTHLVSAMKRDEEGY